MSEDNAEMRQAREAIESKVRAGDYTGARTLIVEARKAIPGLGLASEMLTVCEILGAAEMELSAYGINWYWVLQLFASATPAAIESQYQKIVSQLNVIKNDFPGADLALNFATDAFSVLSDPIKRASFDAKINASKGVPEDPGSLGSSFHKRAASELNNGNGDVDDAHKKKVCVAEASGAVDKMNTSYNEKLERALVVLEEHHAGSTQPAKDFHDFGNARKAECLSTGQIWAAYDEENMPRRYCKITKVIPEKLQVYVTLFNACPQQSHEKKWMDAGFPVACGTFCLGVNKMTIIGPSMLSYMLSDGLTAEPLEIYPKRGEVWAIYRDLNFDWCNDPGMRKSCAFEIVEIIGDYVKDYGAKVTYLVRVHGFRNVFQRYSKGGNDQSFQIPGNKLLVFSHKVPAFRFVGEEMDGISNGMWELDTLAMPDNLVQGFSPSNIVALNFSASQSNEERDCSDEASMTDLMNPSSRSMDSGGSSQGIQSQKMKLTPKDLSQGQVWAVYDGPDMMPRTYVRIDKVVPPTKVSVTFLDPHPMLDREILWVEEELPIVCGIFRAGRATSTLEMSKFSHIVNCDRSSKGSYYRIFPRKGEIWAMYRNWNINWKSSAFSSYQCRAVEMLSDFSEENGAGICSLVEVQGCLTFFQRQVHDGFQLTRHLSRMELLSLSHRIPSFTVTGIKHPDIPNGSLHLEPDALPPKLVS